MRKASLVVYNPRAGVLGSVRAIRVRWGQCRVSFSDRSCLELILKSISLGPGSPGEALSGVSPHGQPAQSGPAEWGWRWEVGLQAAGPIQTACPSLTAGPTGMRAELFVPGKLLQPRER